MGIKIITDSACDLTRDYIKNNNIGLLSLILNLNGQAIKDDLGETLSYKDFYNKMREGATPTTSQINAHEFEEEFIKYIKYCCSCTICNTSFTIKYCKYLCIYLKCIYKINH